MFAESSSLAWFYEETFRWGHLGNQPLAFTEMEMGVLCAIAYHQPVDRAGLKDIFGKNVDRDLLGRLRRQDLIATGPRSPRPGAPHTFVTTQRFLVMFDLRSLRDLPDLEIASTHDPVPHEQVAPPSIERPHHG